MKATSLVFGGLAAVAAGVAALIHVRAAAAQERLSVALASAEVERDTAAADLEAANARASVLAGRTTSLEAELTQARSQLETAEQRAIALARDVDTLRASVAEQEAVGAQLRATNAALTEELVQTRLHAAAADPAELEQLRHTVARLEAELADALAAPKLAADRTSPPAEVRVLGVGPENAFVVLDFGADQGAEPNRLLLVRRGSDPLATVAIGPVHPRHAVAHVVPDTLQGSLRVGDRAFLLP